ncbi:hypothetical protein ABZW32_30325 [Streptomyces sp. NPDC004667]|uniref:hypothetical protein n=1 Tax=Streptomyces sp. NPDC004667 TaxID=3154285 RepID=UPI0033AD4BCB
MTWGRDEDTQETPPHGGGGHRRGCPGLGGGRGRRDHRPVGSDANAVALKAVADEGPGYAVEDFGYPNADKILEERKITLKRGDGHIVLADCGTAGELLRVWSRSDGAEICFKVTGIKGYLTLEVPAVHAIKGNNYATQVDMTVGEEEKTFEIKKNSWTGVGESADAEGRDFILVEIRTAQ